MVTAFTKIANAVTAGDLQTPLGPNIEHDTKIADVPEILLQHDNKKIPHGKHPWSLRPSLHKYFIITKNNNPIAFVQADPLWNESTPAPPKAEDFFKRKGLTRPGPDNPVIELLSAVPLEPSDLVSSDMNGLAASRLAAKDPGGVLFVIDGNDITGSISFLSLFKPLFRAVLFSLTLELEDVALQLLLQSPEQSWKAVPKYRREKIEWHLSKKYYNREQAAPTFAASHLLLETSFSDRGKAICRRELIHDIPGEGIEDVFIRANQVRNDCAHPKNNWYPPSGLDEPDVYWDFVTATHFLINKMREIGDLGGEEALFD